MLYDSFPVITDRLFFHSASADRAPGAGRHETVADPAAYAALGCIPHWRKLLSNFWVADFVWDGLTYRTVEHCFQAAKIALADPTLAREFALESQSALARGDGVAARKQRKLVVLDPQQLASWDREKHGVMQSAMRAKFTQHPELMAVLQATGDAQLWHGTGRGAADPRSRSTASSRGCGGLDSLHAGLAALLGCCTLTGSGAWQCAAAEPRFRQQALRLSSSLSAAPRLQLDSRAKYTASS
jgi:ribA/ribD-fused uncharacterized protein